LNGSLRGDTEAKAYWRASGAISLKEQIPIDFFDFDSIGDSAVRWYAIKACLALSAASKGRYR